MSLPPADFRDWLVNTSLAEHDSPSRRMQAVWINVVASPWELARARRVNRLMAAAAIRVASREPGERSNHWGWDLDDPSVRYAEATTPDLILDLIAPMASFISADDRNEVARRCARAGPRPASMAEEPRRPVSRSTRFPRAG